MPLAGAPASAPDDIESVEAVEGVEDDDAEGAALAALVADEDEDDGEAEDDVDADDAAGSDAGVEDGALSVEGGAAGFDSPPQAKRGARRTRKIGVRFIAPAYAVLRD